MTTCNLSQKANEIFHEKCQKKASRDAKKYRAEIDSLSRLCEQNTDKFLRDYFKLKAKVNNKLTVHSAFIIALSAVLIYKLFSFGEYVVGAWVKDATSQLSIDELMMTQEHIGSSCSILLIFIIFAFLVLVFILCMYFHDKREDRYKLYLMEEEWKKHCLKQMKKLN